MPSGAAFESGEVADAFALGHYDSVRGHVRTAVIDHQLARHRPALRHPVAAAGALDVIDVGGGSAAQSLPLARRGHDVTVLDPSATMLGHARDALAGEAPEVTRRVRLVQAAGEAAADVLGGQRFDVVLCHGVLMYLDDPAPLLDALAALTRPGGLLSIVAANRNALALRAGLQGRWDVARGLLDAERYRNGLGLEARADDPADLSARCRARGLRVLAWYGIRLFTDSWDESRMTDVDGAVEAEAAAAERDPYRQLSRLFHLLAEATPTRPEALRGPARS